jgi:hypothetical protein
MTMTSIKDKMPGFPKRAGLAIGAAALLAVGVAGGAGAVSLTRPAIEMAPTVLTAIGKLPASSGIVTVKGRVVEVFGDRFVLQDSSGRAMIDAGRRSGDIASAGQVVTVQGRYDDGQMRASYVIEANGRVTPVGPAGGPPRGPGGPGRPHHDAPPPPPPPPGGPGQPAGAVSPPCVTPPPAQPSAQLQQR